MKLNELEDALLNQIEVLNDDSYFEFDREKQQGIIERSKAMEGLAGQVVELNRLKLDCYKAKCSYGDVGDNDLLRIV